MKKVIIAGLILTLMNFTPAMACTTMLITKGASKDGSVIVAHSDDSELFDQRLVYVPAADHKPGSFRHVYYDAAALGDRPKYHGYELRRYVGTSRGPTYVDPDQPQSIPLGVIPQVEHTYAYFDASYAVMNEHQLMFGECTDGTKIQPEPVPGKLIFYSAELSRVAAERCKTAREAVELIGHLIETYGYYGTGETLPIGDTQEGWVIEMAPSPEGTGGLWVAKKVPDGKVFVAANELRIREVDKNDPDMLYCKDLHAIAKKHGWWSGHGKLDWLRTVSLGEYSHPYYSLRRVWRLQSRIAPSLAKSPWVKDGFTKEYPFSIKPDKKLGVRDVMSLYRDHYQGTRFDLSKGVTAGPFGSPYRYPGPMDAGGGDTGDPNAKLKGGWERPISIFRCGFSYVCQARSWLPDPIGGVVWFGPDEPMSTCYVPCYAGVTRIAEPFYTCDTTAFSEKSAWWAFNFVANWAGLKYSYMIKDIQQKQDELEHAAMEGMKQMDFEAFALYKKDPDKVGQLLTSFGETQANEIVEEWWKLAWTLVARYDDGYVNAPGKMAQEVGYPEEWYGKSEWPNGPTSYEKPEKKPAESEDTP